MNNANLEQDGQIFLDQANQANGPPAQIPAPILNVAAQQGQPEADDANGNGQAQQPQQPAAPQPGPYYPVGGAQIGQAPLPEPQGDIPLPELKTFTLHQSFQNQPGYVDLACDFENSKIFLHISIKVIIPGPKGEVPKTSQAASP